MNDSRAITVNWRGKAYTFNSTSKIEHFDGYIKIQFDLNPDPVANPTGVKFVTIEHDPQKIRLARSEKGEDLSRSPILSSLSDWINEYYQVWRSLHK